ncbi:2-hydroxychromene-2-carboxylate isomerase [Thalassobaculum sp.]|uniref:2-hydroxychromene-2-carboxylate isomerase n=1 Tax=Thalassobaculum sp. TaxID=2022740 RepID=UPI0032EE737B
MADNDTDDGHSDEPIDFYFDFSSPYGYLAAHKIDDIARLYGRTVLWRPVLLGVIFKTTGAQPLLDIPIKGPYTRRDIERTARFHGVPLEFPQVMPFPSIAAARAVYWVQDREPSQARTLSLALYDRAFAQGGDIRTADAVLEVAHGVGIDASRLGEALSDPAVKERLKTENDAAMAAGVCGSPFFVVDGEPFWGADRLDHVERWLATGGW